MPELLERADLLAQLELDSAEGGRFVFVGGEAGVGKTSLVRAFAERLSERVLHGSCENLTTPTPLGPFVDVAAETGGGLAERIADGDEPRGVVVALLEDADLDKWSCPPSFAPPVNELQSGEQRKAPCLR